jgi:predicted lipoprotein with Yx(FWY)xxD motif
MFRVRAASLVSFAAAGVLLLSACGASGKSDGASAAASTPAATSSAAADLSFDSGTAKQNNATANTGDWAAGAVPAAAAQKPVARKWVQLTAAKVGALDPVVVNGAGFTLYRFDKDTASPSKSNCFGDCAITWPPYLVAPGGRVFLDGVDKSAIGFIERDGALQVTIGGWPVYLFSKDVKAGDTNGQGVGGTWFGVTPDGQKAGQASTPSAGASPTGTPASSVTLFKGTGFADPAQGVAGPGCKNVSFSGSLQGSGFVKIWDGAGCTGRSMFVESDVADLSAIGFGTVKSIRFFN